MPTIASDFSSLRPQPVLNGLFNFMHKEQAHTLPVRVKYHQVQPVTTVSGSAFTQGANYLFDFNVPMNIDILDDVVLEFTLQNTNASNDSVVTALVSFWFQRVEVRVDNDIVQPEKGFAFL